MKKRKKYLFSTLTHGDEIMGKEVMEKIWEEYPVLRKKYDWIITNEKAAKLHKRFIKNNMNRIAPGNINSPDYEEKRVAEVIEKSKEYQSFIDIHTTKSHVGIFTIIGKTFIQNILLSASLPIQRIVFWAPKDKRKGPISNFVFNGIGIEAGPRGDKNIKNELHRIILSFLQQKEFSTTDMTTKEWYQVVSKIEDESFLNRNGYVLSDIENFKLIRIDDEVYYPVMVGSYGIVAFLAKKIQWEDIFIYQDNLLESK